jgi:hypothetical protein
VSHADRDPPARASHALVERRRRSDLAFLTWLRHAPLADLENAADAAERWPAWRRVALETAIVRRCSAPLNAVLDRSSTKLEEP